MATTLISIGPTLTILQNIVYAIPATPVRIVSGAVVQYSNLIGGPFADIANNSQIKAGFIQCVTGATTVTLTKVKMKKSVYFNQVISDGATLFWKLDETTGLVVKDSIGGRDGTISGGVLLGQTGLLNVSGNTSMKFDGISGKVVSAPFSLVPPFTIEGWFRIDALTKAMAIVEHTLGAGEGIQLYTNTGGGTNLWKSNSEFPNVVGAFIIEGIAYHYVLIVLPTKATLYLNGTPFETPTFATNYLGGNFYLGIGGPQSSNWWAGFVDNVAVYNKALTPDQIASHYAAGR